MVPPRWGSGTSARRSTLSLDYGYAEARPTTSFEGFLDLDVTSADCPFPVGGLDQPVTLGSYSGTVSIDDMVVADVSDGRTTMEVFTDLPVDDLDALFASLEPFDPTTRPEAPG